MFGSVPFYAHSIISFELLLVVVSVVAGFVGAIFGLGGGIIIIPFLTLVMGVNIRYAIGASIVSVIATSSGAAASYVRDHITNIRVAMVLEVATTAGALSGALLAGSIPKRTLFLLFSIILLLSAVMMIRKRKEQEILAPEKCDPIAKRLRLNSEYPDQNLGRTISYGVNNVALGSFLMLFAGLISGLLGIGSGALKVPAMDSAMNLPLKVSSATSNFMIGVTAAASAGLYYMNGSILPILAGPVAVGVLIGALLGSHLMPKLDSQKVRYVFVTILLLIAIQMFGRSIGPSYE